MTNRVAYAPQDFQQMCKQAERDHESKKLVVLLDRVKRKIAERDSQAVRPSPQPASIQDVMRLPIRSVPLER